MYYLNYTPPKQLSPEKSINAFLFLPAFGYLASDMNKDCEFNFKFSFYIKRIAMSNEKKNKYTVSV